MAVPEWMEEAGLGVGLDSDMEGDSISNDLRFIRFWMKKATERKIIFLTEGNASPVCWEHQVRLGGKWTNWFTCLSMIGKDCGLCKWAEEHDGAYRRYKAQFFTIIDCAQYTDKRGVEHKNEKKLFCSKKRTSEILKRKYLRRIEEDQGLKLALFNVARTNSDQSSSVGEDFEFIRMCKPENLAADDIDISELDYDELLKPDPEKVKNAVDRLSKETSFDFDGGETEVKY